MEKIIAAIENLRQFSSGVLTLGEPLNDTELIRDFERQYNLELPKDFKFLLTLHNGIDLMGTSVLGFYSNENTESIKSVYEYEHFKVLYPQYPYLVPFSPDGRGNFYCFDTRSVTLNGESNEIVFWTSNYLYTNEDQPEITHSSLAEWINEVMIEWTLEDYNYDGSEK